MKVDNDYKKWLADLKNKIQHSQIKAAVKVNTELLLLYWDLGCDIVSRQMDSVWGSGFFERLSNDLRKEFPDMKGFSETNLKYCKRFYLFYSQESSNRHQLGDEIPHKLGVELHSIENKDVTIRQQVVDEFEKHPIFQISWGHHIQIFTKCKSIKEALFYVQKTIENNWSRAVLEYQIETELYKRKEKITTNFKLTLPKPDSDLANEIMKNEYNFEFLSLSDKVRETDLEKALIQHMAQFLTELGKGFAYMGRQYLLKVGSKEFRTDLLFYHTKLKCYIVIELKMREFDPDFTGKLVFYVTTVDKLLRDETDKPTIGILLCKDKDDIVVDYALESLNRPLGVGKFTYTELADEMKAVLPTLEEFQDELMNFENEHFIDR
ncbi:MAG: PDDEXK nuclease domain-containing protein [Candidatus Cloacimonetes bacterium]|nr:PDDEXK nuclease domain-containing protein [Candidatus Cloacimonadota bacterium]